MISSLFLDHVYLAERTATDDLNKLEVILVNFFIAVYNL